MHDGDVVSGRGVVVYGIDRLPGGADGKWGNYAAFCGEVGVVAATDLALQFEPSVGEAAQSVAGLTVESFTTDWGCGYGFVTSTPDERIALQLQWNGAEPLAAGDIVLPDPSWTANVVVGDFQFINWCDDVIEFYEPFELAASNPAFEISAGTFTMPANDAGTWCSGPVSVVVEGLVVDTPVGEVTFDPIVIENDSFGCFAG